MLQPVCCNCIRIIAFCFTLSNVFFFLVQGRFDENYSVLSNSCYGHGYIYRHFRGFGMRMCYIDQANIKKERNLNPVNRMRMVLDR
jgi:hypothetical protein